MITAFGFRPSPPEWVEEAGIKLTPDGRIQSLEGSRFPFQTANEKLFAGGDAVQGSDLVVTAVAQGRKAAQGMLAYMGV